MLTVWLIWALVVAKAASSVPTNQNSNCSVYNVQSLRQHPACCQRNSSDVLVNQVATLTVALEKLQIQVPAMQVKLDNLQKMVKIMGGNRLPGTCDEPLINGTTYRVEDRQLSSSTISENSTPARSRLHTKKGPGLLYGAWRPLQHNYQWIEVDFERQMQVTAIGTQGADQLAQWVKTYTLSFSDDAVLWRSYVRDDLKYAKYYPGNTDSYTVLKHRINFTARYVRLMPRSYQKFPALRWELYGCPL